MGIVERLDGAVWKKSTGSGDGNCVEVAMLPGIVGVRDSKAPAAGTVVFDVAEWNELLRNIRAGKYDL